MNTLLITILASKPKKGNGKMSKKKKHTDLSQLSRKQLCDRIVQLEKHNAYLEKLVQDDVTTIKELRDIACFLLSRSLSRDLRI
jgi:uncharacterized protein YfeS